jgi:hypothetical protein
MAMVIGRDASRASRRSGRGAVASQPTVREVCLLGMDHCGQSESWTTGQKVTWLGRGYRVVATAAAPPEPLGDPGWNGTGRESPGPRRVVAGRRGTGFQPVSGRTTGEMPVTLPAERESPDTRSNPPDTPTRQYVHLAPEVEVTEAQAPVRAKTG